MSLSTFRDHICLVRFIRGSFGGMCSIGRFQDEFSYKADQPHVPQAQINPLGQYWLLLALIRRIRRSRESFYPGEPL
jgi:hypothetical protein